MLRRIIAATLVLSMVGSPSAFAGGAAAVTVDRIVCVAPNVHPQVVATAPDGTVAARVYFRAAESNVEYWVDMVPSRGDRWTAILPKPAASTRVFTYRVVARDVTGKEIASGSVNQDVQAFCAAGIRDANVVLGQPANAPATVEGWVVPGTPATPAAATAPPATTAPPTATVPPATTPVAAPPPAAVPATTTVPAVSSGGGLTPAMIALLAAAGLGAAWYLYDQNQDEDQVSPSRP